MANTKPKTLSAADAARQHLAEAEALTSEMVAELSTLRQELSSLVAARDGGSLAVDLDRLADLEETIIPRKEKRALRGSW